MGGVPIGLLCVPVLSTLLGGWLALRARNRLAWLIALGTGLLLGTAFLDLLPEALELARTTKQTRGEVLGFALAAFAGFLGFEMLLERVGRGRDQPKVRRTLGRVSGALLIVHSFRDGMVIGAAYAASHSAGLIVTLGIVAHDVGDGMNTVILSTRGERATLFDYAFLAADAVAPLLGGLLTIWWVQSTSNAVALLAVAAGFFVQMALSDLLRNPKEFVRAARVTVPISLGGVGFIYIATRMAQGLGR